MLTGASLNTSFRIGHCCAHNVCSDPPCSWWTLTVKSPSVPDVAFVFCYLAGDGHLLLFWLPLAVCSPNPTVRSQIAQQRASNLLETPIGWIRSAACCIVPRNSTRHLYALEVMIWWRFGLHLLSPPFSIAGKAVGFPVIGLWRIWWFFDTKSWRLDSVRHLVHLKVRWSGSLRMLVWLAWISAFCSGWRSPFLSEYLAFAPSWSKLAVSPSHPGD